MSSTCGEGPASSAASLANALPSRPSSRSAACPRGSAAGDVGGGRAVRERFARTSTPRELDQPDLVTGGSVRRLGSRPWFSAARTVCGLRLRRRCGRRGGRLRRRAWWRRRCAPVRLPRRRRRRGAVAAAAAAARRRALRARCERASVAQQLRQRRAVPASDASAPGRSRRRRRRRLRASRRRAPRVTRATARARGRAPGASPAGRRGLRRRSGDSAGRGACCRVCWSSKCSNSAGRRIVPEPNRQFPQTS